MSVIIIISQIHVVYIEIEHNHLNKKLHEFFFSIVIFTNCCYCYYFAAVVFLYGYIREKDIFERDYQKYLADRLLNGFLFIYLFFYCQLFLLRFEYILNVDFRSFHFKNIVAEQSCSSCSSVQTNASRSIARRS